jgi:DhnA family fructose-bisphosphate aldolase class Ia
MGGVGFTIYPGSSKQDEMINYFGKIQEHKPDNVKSILWSYPRGGDFYKTTIKTIMHAAYMAAQLEPDVIKVKMPTNTDDVTNIIKAACNLMLSRSKCQQILMMLQTLLKQHVASL